jgi:molecular chaperone DnaJ
MATVEQDFYEVLGVARTADGETIKRAYRRLAVELHPDKHGGCKDAEGRFKALNEAYDCLKDPQKRAAYDRFGHAAFRQGMNGQGPGAADMSGFADIFENIFGEFMGGQRGRGGRPVHRGQDLRYDLELTLEEAFAGKPARIDLSVSVQCDSCDGSGAKPGTRPTGCKTCAGHGKVRAQQGFFMVERTCPTCHGAGEAISDPCTACRGIGRVEREKSLDVTIPAGVDDGTRIRLAGEGEAGLRGGPAGDLYIFVHLKPHALFQREGTTLFAAVPVPFTTAALGGEVELPGIDRVAVTVRIPAGTQSGKQFRVRGRGMPPLGGQGFGDLVVQAEVEIPTRLTARQKELLEEFRATEEGEGSFPRSRGFLDRLKGAWDELTE